MIESILDSLDREVKDNRVVFSGLLPYGFIDMWDNLTTEEQFNYVSLTLGYTIKPTSIQFIEIE